MKKHKTKMSTLVIALSVMSMSLTSCYVTRTTVGNGPVGKDQNVEVYSKAKQMYLLSGLIALNQADPKKPTDGNYQVITNQNLWDAFVSGFTGSIFCMRTIKIVVKKK